MDDREIRKKELASAIRDVISALGWTPSQAALALGVPEGRLAYVLNGDVLCADEWTLEDWRDRLRAEGALKTDIEALEAVSQNGAALEWVPERLKTPALCLQAVRDHGTALRHVPPELRTEALCREAVLQNGYALCWVPDTFKTAELCAEAVRRDGWALKAVPEKLKTPELCLEAVTCTGKALEFVPEALKSEEICRAAVRADRKALLVTPLALVDRLAEEWPAWDMARQRAWGAWRAAAIAGRITLEQAEEHGVEQFLPRESESTQLDGDRGEG